jgi:hypothetical protein
MKSELIGLKGGRKQQWLRLHRREIDNFYFAHGPEATAKEYGMTGDTLIHYLDRSRKDTVINKLSQADKWVYEACNAGTAEVRERVRDLEDWQKEVEPIINVGRSLIAATMRNIESKVGNTPLLGDRSQAQQLSRKSKE